MRDDELSTAIAHYHELLTPDVAQASWGQLEDAMRSKNLVFGDRPICNVLRPYFLTRDEASALYRASRSIVSGLDKIFAALSRDAWELVLGLSPAEAALASVPCGFSPAVTIGRLDAFLTRGKYLGFVEFNSESPGGIGFGAELARIFRELPIVRRFGERYLLTNEPTIEHTLDALLSAYRAWGGASQKPNIAIVDRTDARTFAEFVLCQETFRARGFATEIVDPSELELANGRLHSGAFEIDLVYRRIVASDVAANLGLSHPLVRAANEGAACIASGFGAFAMLSKAMFALLSDPRTSSVLDSDEQLAARTYIPWTRVLRDERCENWFAQQVDLVEFVLDNREELVVKPATDYGGSGVYLGWLTSPSEWHAAVRKALEVPSVVQRRIPVPSETFPRIVDGSLRHDEYFADIDPYLFAGQTGLGAGTRLSPSQLLNVSAGGGSAVPVFIVEPR
jgi:uncharacterized circularly permuted ATP-grasp superfamily protein